MFFKRTLTGVVSGSVCLMASTPRKLARSRNIIGERLRQARQKLTPPITQDQLSGRLAVVGVQLDRVAITKIENGTRSVFDFELRAFATVLKTDVRWLLGMSVTNKSRAV